MTQIVNKKLDQVIKKLKARGINPMAASDVTVADIVDVIGGLTLAEYNTLLHRLEMLTSTEAAVSHWKATDAACVAGQLRTKQLRAELRAKKGKE